MTLREAEALAFVIVAETQGKATTETRQIGNGEWVIRYNSSAYIWDAQDWARVGPAVDWYGALYGRI